MRFGSTDVNVLCDNSRKAFPELIKGEVANSTRSAGRAPKLPVGTEQQSNSSGKSQFLAHSAAESAVIAAQLQFVTDAWPLLPAPCRLAIVCRANNAVGNLPEECIG